ncbi:zinc-ribbon domain-containing protein [Pendulispora rubella]|uniref:Zinc-ribbon domain-containing protein n=2 Tax=Pendulispora rubella TaxID=2741070 RepID=A0ABZ2LHB6_9BACT
MQSEHPCPFCNGRKLSVTNCLQATYPKIAAQWHPAKNAPVTAADILPGAARKFWWRCTFGHEWRVGVYNRTAVGSGCPQCSLSAPGNARPAAPKRFEPLIRGYNDGVPRNNPSAPSKFVADFPHLVAQWVRDLNFPDTPGSVGAGSDKRIWWKCPVGSDHLWQATPWKRAAAEQGCPYCSGKRVSYTNSLAKNFPAVAEQWHPTKNGELTPDDVVATSCRTVWWRCPQAPDHVWQTKVEDRTRKSYGCPFCWGRRLCVSNSLARVAPKIAAWWHPTKNGQITPKGVTAHSQTKRWWKCPEGVDHVWQASVAQRIRHPKCPMCKMILPSKTTTLKATAPTFARYWHPTKNAPLKPSDVSAASSKRVWWKCPKGADHEWCCSVAARIKAKNHCPYCAGRKLSVTNSLETTHPRLASEWHPKKNAPTTPRNILPGTARKFWWKCASDHEWPASPANRTLRGSGCPVCARRTHPPARRL